MAVAQTTAPESAARELCQNAIKNRAQHPSTVDIHSFAGYSTTTKADGTRLTKQIYSEMNDYGLQLTYNAYCTLTADGKFSFWVEERR